LSGSWRRIERRPRAKVRPVLFVDGNLQHAFELVFDRVLDGDQLVLAAVDLAERGIQRGRLAAAGGAGDEQHAVGHGGEPAQRFEGDGLEAEAVERERGQFVGERAAVEDAQHRVLAVDAWHDRDAQVDFAPLVADAEAPVLRHAPLGDVEFGHDLDARDDLFGQLAALQAADRHQHAVDAVADGHAAGQRFEVDVAGTGLEGIVQRRVHQPHHRTGVAGDALERELLDAGSARAGGGDAAEAVDGARSFLVAVQAGGDVGAVRDADARGFAQHGADAVAQCAVERVGERQPVRTRCVAQQDAFEAQGVAEAELFETGFRRLQEGHVERRQVDRGRQPRDELGRRQRAAFLDRLDQAPPCRRRAGGADFRGGKRQQGGFHLHWMFSASWKIGR